MQPLHQHPWQQAMVINVINKTLQQTLLNLALIPFQFQDLATSNGGKQSAATTPTSLAAGDGDQRGPKRSLQCMVMAAGLPDAPENLPLPSFCKATKQQDQYVPSVMQGVICSR